MSPAITASPPQIIGGCLRCSCGWPHTAHDTSLPAAQRSSIQAPAGKGAR